MTDKQLIIIGAILIAIITALGISMHKYSPIFLHKRIVALEAKVA